jgi:uncharacterized protein (DUF433 family)
MHARANIYEHAPGPHHDRPGNLPWQTAMRGLRYPVEMIHGLLTAGMSHSEILADYPDLEREDILTVRDHTQRTHDEQSSSAASTRSIGVLGWPASSRS